MARTLTVKRKRHLLQGAAAVLSVVVDGEEVGKLKNGEEATYEISEEAHILTVGSFGAKKAKAQIRSGSQNVAYLAESSYGWNLTEIEAPQPAREERRTAASYTQEDKDIAYMKEVLSMVSKVLNDPDAATVEKLETLVPKTIEVLGRHNDDVAWTEFLGMHTLVIAKYYLEDEYDPYHAADFAFKSVTAFRIGKTLIPNKYNDPNDNTKFYAHQAVIYDAYCKMVDQNYDGILTDIVEQWPEMDATVTNLALTNIAMAWKRMNSGSEDLFPCYQAFVTWNGTVRKNNAPIQPLYLQDLYSHAYNTMRHLLITGSQTDPRIPKDPMVISQLITDMTLFSMRLTDEDCKGAVEGYIKALREYEQELLKA